MTDYQPQINTDQAKNSLPENLLTHIGEPPGTSKLLMNICVYLCKSVAEMFFQNQPYLIL